MHLTKTLSVACAALMLAAGVAQAKPLVQVTGTLRYDPAKTFNSYVIMTTKGTTKLIDRNGNLVKEWDNKSEEYGFPAKAYPGGIIGTTLYDPLPTGGQDMNTVAFLDFDGNVIRKFNRLEKVDEIPGTPKDKNGETWVARQHHDYQIEGTTTGYYAPGQKPNFDGKMLVLAHENSKHPGINQSVLLDDIIVIVDKDENILWKWAAADHFEELGYTEDAIARTKMLSLPRNAQKHQGIDWLHINCASWLGPNKWYDAGDERFHPDNIICDSRNTSHMFIIDHKTGKIVWQVAPPFVGENARLGKFAGIHHTHMIPKGLPGEGNILVFDNGGTVIDNMYINQNHAYSRVVEYDPITKKKVWEYSAISEGVGEYMADNLFYSQFISSAQRLPNGNTYITEGSCSRFFEVTPKGEVVWEYVNPYNAAEKGALIPQYTYRSYAVPYDYFPQLKKPVETAVVPPKHGAIVLPDVNGKVPNIQPVMDKRAPVQFGELTPVATEAWKKAAK